MADLLTDARALMRLERDLRDFMTCGDEEVDAGWFNDLALRLYRWHLEAIPAYAAFCAHRGAHRDNISDWTAIPPLPVTAFKQASLFCHGHERAAITFKTSGSTASKAGEVHYDRTSLEMMDLSIELNARRWLFPDDRRRRILALAPSRETAPHMIMAYGLHKLMDLFGTPESAFLVGPQGPDVSALIRHVEEARALNQPVALVGSSFGYVNLADGFAAKGLKIPPLPEHSLLMDAGGYKGRSRELPLEEFRALIGNIFGLTEDAMVNLLGMTELSSQFYDDTLSAIQQGKTPLRLKQNPRWTRTRIVDPDDTLRELPLGERGLMVHVDLTNWAHPISLVTDDIGVREFGGFRILGRAAGAESRGCSVTLEELAPAKD
ncbi:MAG: hypothetical protein GMKNLPBB_01784 [Myxococcota bacterium]|nr:hypothetical protein [Myxococcota bacterium]